MSCHEGLVKSGSLLPKAVTNDTLGRVAAGLNIEGGYPAMDHVKGKCRWVNMVSVLDRPLIDNLSFEELKAIVVKNKYKLLEAGVDNLDEKRLLQILITIFAFYVTKYKSIIVHIHQAPEDAQGLQEILLQSFIALKEEKKNQVDCKVEWRTDHPVYKRPQPPIRDDVECFLSFSQCAGFLSCQPPGTLLIPNRFTPFDVKTNTVHSSKAYQVNNSLQEDIVEIALAREYHDFAAKCTMNYQSQNKKKVPSDVLGPLDPADFIDCFRLPNNLLQVTDLWNPTPKTAKQTIHIN